MDLHLREPKACEPRGHDLLWGRLLEIRAAGLLLPVARKNSGDPMGELVLEELQVRERVVSSGRHRTAFEVRPAGRVDHVHERTCLAEIVEELVAQTPALVRLRDETRDIEQLDGDETRAILARRILGLASMAKLRVRASLPHEGHASVRLDCCERVVRDLDRRQRGRGEERGLADVRFPYDSQLHVARNVNLPQVPLATRTKSGDLVGSAPATNEEEQNCDPDGERGTRHASKFGDWNRHRAVLRGGGPVEGECNGTASVDGNPKSNSLSRGDRNQTAGTAGRQIGTARSRDRP